MRYLLGKISHKGMKMRIKIHFIIETIQIIIIFVYNNLYICFIKLITDFIMNERTDFNEQEKEQDIKLKDLEDAISALEWLLKYDHIKVVTLKELKELGKANPNYTFSHTPDETPGCYENFKTYVDSDGSYIDGDIINYCDGFVKDCLKCFINFFDENDKYLESYRLRPTMEELDDMETESRSLLLNC
jgi:uncharacterized protein YheU (UPF0270 family)